jgi:cytochrome c-type biogenesis protein CcmH/NrfG
LAAYAEALRLDPKHLPARQALVVLMLERRQLKEAQDVLREGLAASPSNVSWTICWPASSSKGQYRRAVETLEKGLPYGPTNPNDRGFVATVLQMQSRHRERSRIMKPPCGSPGFGALAHRAGDLPRGGRRLPERARPTSGRCRATR